MGFNAEAYRRDAKALGLSDEQIDQDIAEETAGQQETFAEPTKENVDLNKDQTVPGWLQPALGAAGIGLAAKGGKSIYDRWMGGGSGGGQGVRIEPQMDVSVRAPEGRIEPTWEPQQAINQANGMQMKTAEQATQEAIAQGKIVPGVGGKITETEAQMLGASEKAKAEKEIAKKGIKPPEQKTFATAEELQAKRPGTVFKPGWGGADSWLVDQVGKDRAKLIRETMNQGQPFGGTKADLERAAQAMSEFGNLNWQHQHEPHIPSRENRIRLGIEPPEQHGALNKTFKNAVKVGGTAGLLLTAAEAANAAQREKGGEKGATNEFLFNLLSAIPGLGAAFNAGTFSGGLNTNEEQELARRRQMSPTISR